MRTTSSSTTTSGATTSTLTTKCRAKSGKVSFNIPAECPNMWLGIYYIKDYSIARGGDYARIANVRIYANIPVGVN